MYSIVVQHSWWFFSIFIVVVAFFAICEISPLQFWYFVLKKNIATNKKKLNLFLAFDKILMIIINNNFKENVKMSMCSQHNSTIFFTRAILMGNTFQHMYSLSLSFSIEHNHLTHYFIWIIWGGLEYMCPFKYIHLWFAPHFTHSPNKFITWETQRARKKNSNTIPFLVLLLTAWNPNVPHFFVAIRHSSTQTQTHTHTRI